MAATRAVSGMLTTTRAASGMLAATCAASGMLAANATHVVTLDEVGVTHVT